MNPTTQIVTAILALVAIGVFIWTIQQPQIPSYSKKLIGGHWCVDISYLNNNIPKYPSLQMENIWISHGMSGAMANNKDAAKNVAKNHIKSIVKNPEFTNVRPNIAWDMVQTGGVVVCNDARTDRLGNWIVDCCILMPRHVS